MEPIEKETLDYLRIALYGLRMSWIAENIESSKTTATNAIKHGIGSKDTWDKLLGLAKVVRPDLKLQTV